MSLNKQSGNMYDFCNYTFNPIRGECEHNCDYCYMHKIWKWQRNKGIDTKLKIVDKFQDLGSGNTIFVGSSTDMFAKYVPSEWILKVLEHCRGFPENDYLFQSKNPDRLFEFYEKFPPRRHFCTTMETNRDNIADSDKFPNLVKMNRTYPYYYPGMIGYREVSLAPRPSVRVEPMSILQSRGERVLVTVEPIFDFDIDRFIQMLETIDPLWVNIGADSKKNGMPEPDPWKVVMFIKELGDHDIKVKPKPNLKRLIGKKWFEELMK